jgi:hypothetical protein
MKNNKREPLVTRILGIKKTRWNEVYPFTQQPSPNQFPGSELKPKEMEVTELFSRFTADIIREDVRFTR